MNGAPGVDADTSGERAAAASVRDGAPRPLSAYVSAAATSAQQAIALCAGAADPRFPWRPSLKVAGVSWAREVAGRDEATAARLRAAIARRGLGALSAMLDGIERYRRAPTPPTATPGPAIWRAGAATLRDCGAADGAALVADDPRPALLVLPSLINRARILDLTPDRSFVRGLAARGVRPYLLDWGAPGREERGFGLADVVLKRVAPALAAIAARHRGRVSILGHCMSGPLALAAAQRAETLGEGVSVDKVVVMGAPWRYGAYFDGAPPGPSRETLERLVSSCSAVFGGLPRDVLDTLFFLRDPLQPLRKFPAYAALAPDSARAKLFTAVEDWLNDGVLLPGPAAQTLLIDWSLDSALTNGGWSVDGVPTRPGALRAPILSVASRADTLVPYASATGLFADAPRARLLRPSAGHVGMIVGRRAEHEVWGPVARWLTT